MMQRLTPEQAADQIAIVDTVNAYSHALDDKDRDLFVDLFTPDGAWTWKGDPDDEWAFRVEGAEALGEWYDGHFRNFPIGRENHITVHTRVTLDGDRATAVSFYFVIRDVDDLLRVNTTGRYYDKLRRCEDGGWRIEERRAIGQMPNRAFRARSADA